MTDQSTIHATKLQTVNLLEMKLHARHKTLKTASNNRLSSENWLIVNHGYPGYGQISVATSRHPCIYINAKNQNRAQIRNEVTARTRMGYK